MSIKATALFAALMALGPAIASPLAPRSCSGETPYVFLSVHDWLKVDVLDKDPAVPSQQWGTYGSFLQGFNFSIADQYYTEHFIATAYVQNGEWNRDDPVNLVEEKKFDCRITAEEGIDQQYCGNFIHLYSDGKIINQAEGDGKGGTVRAGCTAI